MFAHANPLHEMVAWNQIDKQLRFVEYQLQGEHAQFILSELHLANSQYYSQFKHVLSDIEQVPSPKHLQSSH